LKKSDAAASRLLTPIIMIINADQLIELLKKKGPGKERQKESSSMNIFIEV